MVITTPLTISNENNNFSSSVRNGKTPVIADYSNFAPWSNFWRFFGQLQDDAVLLLPLDRIAPNSVSWAFAGHSIGIER